jgi:hypothetical protein
MANYSYNLQPNESWGKGTVEIGPPAPQGESRVRRLEKTQDRLVTGPMEGIDTVHDVLLYASRTHGTHNAFGYRDIIDTIEEQKEVVKTVGGKEVRETKTWKYFQLSDYKYISYLEFKSAVSEVSRGLLKLEVEKGDVFNIYAQTRLVSRDSFIHIHPPRPSSLLFFCFLFPTFHSLHSSLLSSHHTRHGFPHQSQSDLQPKYQSSVKRLLFPYRDCEYMLRVGDVSTSFGACSGLCWRLRCGTFV